jgi:hypothetical protein
LDEIIAILAKFAMSAKKKRSSRSWWYGVGDVVPLMALLIMHYGHPLRCEFNQYQVKGSKKIYNVKFVSSAKNGNQVLNG